ncbi:hypothetical protein BY996DRAFT_6470040 [Phakopsora pachyrhizi]|nr:hypothetical protein BY996DRAFT_6617682 [Phakopsora pachyrhizi]KAI8455424.1 hypothetical protein BY996DRAFT_6470040 [Phakopsora pachyrhizi]
MQGHGHQEDMGDWQMASDEDLRLKSDKKIKPRMEQREILANQRKVTIGEKQKLVNNLRILEIRECYPVVGVMDGSTERCCALQARFGTRHPNLSLGGWHVHQALEYGWWFVEGDLSHLKISTEQVKFLCLPIEVWVWPKE